MAPEKIENSRGQTILEKHHIMKRQHLIIALGLVIGAGVLCYTQNGDDNAHSKVASVRREAPATTDNIWIDSAYETAYQIEDTLLRDEILCLLVPVSLRLGDSQFALAVLGQIQNKVRKVSVLTELSLFARRKGITSDFRLHMDSALRIADAIFKNDGQAGYAHMAIASALVRNGFVADAVDVALSVCTHDPDWDFWEEWFFIRTEDLALLGHYEDAKSLASSIPWPRKRTTAYIAIASIQHRDGYKAAARNTLLEAIKRVVDFGNSYSKAHGYALIAAAFARIGDHEYAQILSTISGSYLPLENVEALETPDGAKDIARALIELAHTSHLLGDSVETQRLLESAEMWSKRIGNSEAEAIVRCEMAEVLMAMDEMDSAFAIADSMRDTSWHSWVLGCIITHELFSSETETVDSVMGSVRDEYERNDVALSFVLSLLRHGRIAEAEEIALTISDQGVKNEAFSWIVENLCAQGFVERAIQLASQTIHDPWDSIDLFILIGQTLAETKLVSELHDIIEEQTNYVRRASMLIGIAQALTDK